MARFRGLTKGEHKNHEVEHSLISPSDVTAQANGWDVGGTAEVHPANAGDKSELDQVILYATGGSNANSLGHIVAEVTQTKDGLPELHVYLPPVVVRKSDYSLVVLHDDETNAETVIYTAPKE